MAKFLLFAGLVGSASAFAPSSVVTSKTSIDAFAGGMVGNEGPEPMPPFVTKDGTSKDFDPFGFTKV